MEITRITVGDIYELKKKHPCGSTKFEVVRSGVDCKIKCLGCEHIVLIDRLDIKKSIKNVILKKEDSEK